MLHGFQVNLGKAWVDHVTPGWGEDEVGGVTLTMADCANLSYMCKTRVWSNTSTRMWSIACASAV